MDIGNFSRHTILTGAGWSRNWGGRLAQEMWEDLIGHVNIQRNEGLRNLLLGEGSFETALAMTRRDPFGVADRAAFEAALLETFIAMDREIARPDHNPWINIYKVQDLLFRFWGRRDQGINTGYLFTLNQDLWPERHLYNEHVYGAPTPSLPGLQRRPDQRMFTTDIGRYTDRFVMHPIGKPEEQGRLVGNFNVIKLHGSFNWQTGEGLREMVVGTEKTLQIQSSALLKWYSEIFRRVLTAGDVRLMIVGYGFGDEHVNAVVSDAIQHHGLKVFVWNVDSALRQRILEAPHGAAIWSGLLSTATRPLIEVFPSNQAETQEYSRICATVFG